MFSQNYINISLSSSYYCMSIIYMNIYIYIFLLYMFFSLLFLYDLKKMKTLNDLKVFGKYSFVSISLILVFLSMSGIPPLAGFVGKFLLFNFLFFLQKYIYIVVLSSLNFFSLYFYIQNLRFIVSKTQLNFLLVSGFRVHINKHLLDILVLFNSVNFFGILYMEDIFYIFININLYKNTF